MSEVWVNGSFHSEAKLYQERPDVLQNLQTSLGIAQEFRTEVNITKGYAEVIQVKAVLFDSLGNREASNSVTVKLKLPDEGVHLDEILWRNNEIMLRGWVFWQNAPRPWYVQFYLNDALLEENICNLSRPYLRNRLPQEWRENCYGFRLTHVIPTESLSEKSILKIVVKDTFGNSIMRKVSIQPQSGIASDVHKHKQAFEHIISDWQQRYELSACSFLDAHCVLPSDIALPSELTAFSPKFPLAESKLPYVSKSIDFVLVSHPNEDMLDEARRVARLGICYADDDQLFAEHFTIESTIKLPSVSIIIPAYNQVDFTHKCLLQLRKTLPTGFDGEILLINDASTDNTAEVVAELAREWKVIKLVNQVGNQGFISNCNLAANMAYGDYLIFLNNDTLPQAGWLQALLDIFQNFADVGAVGGKLIYPDNTLQETGGIIFSDGSGWNFGRNDPSQNYPLYNCVREVDYCSGALLATPRYLFLELGGFDTRYSPAYYEDVDYCFKVRSHHKKVYVQPKSVVIHFEGITSGRDIAKGVKKHQAINIRKFLKKWETALKQQPILPSEYKRAELHRLVFHQGSNKHFLVCSPTLPEFDRTAGDKRIYHFITMLLGAGYHVTLWAKNMAVEQRYITALEQMGVMVCAGDESVDVGDRFVPDIETLLANNQFDAVLIAFWYLAENLLPKIRHYSPQAQVITDSIDLHFLRTARGRLRQEMLSDQDADNYRREINTYAQSDYVITVSQKEATYINDILGETEKAFEIQLVEVVPQHELISRKKRKGIIFLANFGHPPNVDALEFLIRDVLPLIPSQVLANHPISIVGNAFDRQLFEQYEGVPNIRFIGWVPQIEPYMQKAYISVVPLRYGAGTKRKIINSLLAGTPTVTTSIGAEGYTLEHGKHVLLSNSAKEFAEHITILVSDAPLWSRLAQKGYQKALETNSYSAIEKQFLAKIEALISEI